MREMHVLRCEGLMGRCKNTLGQSLVPYEVIATVVGCIVQYAVPP